MNLIQVLGSFLHIVEGIMQNLLSQIIDFKTDITLKNLNKSYIF